MGQTRRKDIDLNDGLGHGDADDKPPLDEQAVNSILESAHDEDHRHSTGRGIRNGLLIGAAIWVIGLIAVVAFVA